MLCVLIRFLDSEEEWERIPWYDYVIIDDASQVADDELFPMLNLNTYRPYPKGRNWP